MIDLQKYKADMARARDAGITFEAVRDIMSDHLREDDDGTSFGRMVEQIRELALQAADRMAAERRDISVAASMLEEAAETIERGEHRREEER